MTSQEEFAILLFSPSVIPDSFETSWTVAPQAPLSMGFPGQEYWSGLPFPPPISVLLCYKFPLGACIPGNSRERHEWVESIDGQAIDAFHFEKYIKPTPIQSERFPASPPPLTKASIQTG